MCPKMLYICSLNTLNNDVARQRGSRDVMMSDHTSTGMHGHPRGEQSVGNRCHKKKVAFGGSGESGESEKYGGLSRRVTLSTK